MLWRFEEEFWLFCCRWWEKWFDLRVDHLSATAAADPELLGICASSLSPSLVDHFINISTKHLKISRITIGGLVYMCVRSLRDLILVSPLQMS